MDKFLNKFIFNSYRMVWSMVMRYCHFCLMIVGNLQHGSDCTIKNVTTKRRSRFNTIELRSKKIRFIIKLKSIDLNEKNLNNFGKPQIFIRPFSKHLRRHILSYPAISHPSPLSVIVCPRFEASILMCSQNNHVVVITGWYKNMAPQ